MTSIDNPRMTDECKNSLMEVFYFISRDFKYVDCWNIISPVSLWFCYRFLCFCHFAGS